MGFVKKTSVLLLSSAIFLAAGCANLSENQWVNKENIGTLVGVTAGVLIGSQVGNGSGRKAAMIAGALAGGYLGKTIGAKLDTRDREALAQQTQQALQNAQDGQSSQWTSAHSGATATITPVKTETVQRQVAVKRSPKVQPVANMTLINQPYRAVKSANVRNAPNLNAEKVAGLPVDTTFTAIGRTDNDWIMVGRRGVTIGYVYAPLVEQVKARPTQTSAGSAVADVATDLDSLDLATASSKGIDLDAIDLDAVPLEQQVTAQATCRTLNYDVTAKGSSEQQTVKACQAADGAWELI
ncbi:MAG: SH3 domain-containing protein [Gammaproteobacteria bacterium]|nr:SH3 domain-containing protein [Gammaproteobacteria bacterium]MBU2158300.1 SH3 domain-containing protein [Gammaproteobacteria bacterium]MBU2254675.1 SH3 domain-containing protein [Gammaproteobacteria bacterium]MBU2294549.1 SH3 domain-containing protein [Gammaproteobacteria bacterium]